MACLPSGRPLCPLLVGAREPELRCKEAQSSWFHNNVQPVWFGGLEPVPVAVRSRERAWSCPRSPAAMLGLGQCVQGVRPAGALRSA